jgi:DNA replication protein DnaC
MLRLRQSVVPLRPTFCHPRFETVGSFSDAVVCYSPLGFLLDGELAERHHRSVALNLKFAKFPTLKRLEDFDFKAQPGLDSRLIEELGAGRFLYEGRNVVLLGPPGVGKTHLVIGLGVMTAERGHRFTFTTAIDLATRLTRAIETNRLRYEMQTMVQPKLLIIDESLDDPQASLLFQVVCQRYQKERSVIPTSNKPFGQWAQVFGGDGVMASAALDRLLHRATVINIRGESYRLKSRRRAKDFAGEEDQAVK